MHDQTEQAYRVAGTGGRHLLECFCKVVVMGKGHFNSACHQLTVQGGVAGEGVGEVGGWVGALK